MNRLAFFLSVLGLFAASCPGADTFYLVTQSGDKYGPIEFKEGATINVGKQTLEVAKVMTDRQKMEERLKNISIPEADFVNASMQQVADFLNAAVKKYDTKPLPAGVKPINVMLDVDGSNASSTNAAPASGAAVETESSNSVPRTAITLSAKAISAYELISVITKSTGMKYSTRDNIVFLMDEDAPEGPIVQRMYHVLPVMYEKTVAARADDPGAGVNNSSEADGLKGFFLDLGVQWPRGSRIKHMPSIGQLFVANTLENLSELEKILSILNVTPSQVEIEVHFVAFAKADIAKLASTGVVDMASLNLLRQQGRGDLLAAPKVVTQSGAEATAKGTTAYVLRSLSNVVENAGARTNTAVAADEGAHWLCGLKENETGVSLDVLPEVTSDGSMIILTINPQLISELWRWGCDAKGTNAGVRMEMPLFHTDTVTTAISIVPGATILFGGGFPDKDGDHLIYLFVTVRQLGIDGKPLAVRGSILP